MDPSPFTLRELQWMRDGHDRAAWTHTAHLLWVLFNANRVPGSPPVAYDDVNPYARQDQRAKAVKADPEFEREMARIEWAKATRDRTKSRG